MWVEHQGYYLPFVVIQSLSHVWFCDPMDCSAPCSSVLHCHPEFAQTHVPWAGDAIWPFHPLPPSSLAFSLSHIRVFFNESALHIRWPKYWNFSFSISPSSEYLGLISFRTDWFICLILSIVTNYIQAQPLESWRWPQTEPAALFLC